MLNGQADVIKTMSIDVALLPKGHAQGLKLKERVRTTIAATLTFNDDYWRALILQAKNNSPCNADIVWFHSSNDLLLYISI